MEVDYLRWTNDVEDVGNLAIVTNGMSHVIVMIGMNRWTTGNPVIFANPV